MRRLFAPVLLVVLAIAPVTAKAQAPTTPSGGDLEIERKGRKAVVLPKPTAEQVRSDADRAIDDYVGRSPGQTVRETSPVRPSSRPDLDYDVKQGIQTNGVNRELFKR